MPGTEKIRGHVEKKKEWIRRARDFQEKNSKIRQLKRKALERNPDEFHYHMINSQVGFDGVHRDFDDSSDEDNETQKLLSDIRDLRYVKHKHSVELKKIDKLKGTHLSNREHRELKKRIVREKELRIVAQKLELKKDLSKKSIKPKLVKKGAPTRAAIYKWTYERKR